MGAVLCPIASAVCACLCRALRLSRQNLSRARVEDDSRSTIVVIHFPGWHVTLYGFYLGKSENRMREAIRGSETSRPRARDWGNGACESCMLVLIGSRWIREGLLKWRC